MATQAVYRGSLTLGGCLPLAVSAQAAAAGAAGIGLAEFNAKLAGVVAALAQLGITPPSLGLQAAALLAVNPTPPSVDALITAQLAVKGLIEASLGSLNAYAALAASLEVTLGGAGVHLITATGRNDEIGPQLRSVLIGGLPGASPGDSTAAILLAATAPEGKAALSAVSGLQLG